MAKTDPELGKAVHQHLVGLGLENPVDFDAVKTFSVGYLEKGFADVCEGIGLSATDPSTKGTAHRLAKMYKNEICWGLDYDQFPACMITPSGGLDEIVLGRKIEVKSLCEHHFMPVIGFAHVAYLPNEALLGLSKLNRVVEFFSRRPQLQERLGAQISAALKFILNTDDVAVVIQAEHLCVKFRGIQDGCSDTVTSHMSGRFRSDFMARQELLALISM